MDSSRRESVEMSPPSSCLKFLSRPSVPSHIPDERREDMGSPSIRDILRSMPKTRDATNGTYRDMYREQYLNVPNNSERRPSHPRYNIGARESQELWSSRYINGSGNYSHTLYENLHKRKFSSSSISSENEQFYRPLQDKTMIPKLPEYADLNCRADKRPIIKRNVSSVIEKAVDEGGELDSNHEISQSIPTNEDNLDPTSAQSCRVKWCTKPGKRFGLCCAHGGVKRCCHIGCRKVASAGEFCFVHEREISRAVTRRNTASSPETINETSTRVRQNAQPMIVNRA